MLRPIKSIRNIYILIYVYINIYICIHKYSTTKHPKIARTLTVINTVFFWFLTKKFSTVFSRRISILKNYQAPLKQSNVEYSVNYQILYMFFALLGLSVISTVGKILVSKFICTHWYMWNIMDVEPAYPFNATTWTEDFAGGADDVDLW